MFLEGMVPDSIISDHLLPFQRIQARILILKALESLNKHRLPLMSLRTRKNYLNGWRLQVSSSNGTLSGCILKVILTVD